jgi:voltage-gated potassium channel
MGSKERLTSGERPWQRVLFRVMFGTGTRAGEIFDLVLMAAILLSIAAVMLESVESIQAAHGGWLKGVEWGFTLLFTAEFVLRLLCVKRPTRYAASFFGVVDFLAVVPTYLALLASASQPFLVVRVLRLLRVFRILKMRRYVRAGDTIWAALVASRQKIAVFMAGVLTLVVVIGTLMYLIEGPERGFSSIPASIYWAVVTLTTVGYGDIAPQTIPGQMLASVVMILGYGIIAVPTGIVTVEMGKVRSSAEARRRCAACAAAGHEPDAAFCKACGAAL